MNDNSQHKSEKDPLTTSVFDLHTIFNGITDVVIVLDREGRYLDISPRNPELVYKPVEEMIGKTVIEILPPVVANLFLKSIEESLKEKKAVSFEYMLPIDNEEVWFNGRLKAITDNTLVFVGRNITYYKNNEIRLHKSKANLKAMFDASPLAYHLIDKDLRLLTHNKIAADYALQNFGILLKNGIYFPSFAAYEKDEFANYAQRCLKGEHIVFEKTAVFGDDKTKWFKINYLPIKSSAQLISAFSLTVLDITDQKEAELQIFHQQQQLEANNLELQSFNEELQALNEEFAATNDELHAVNAELENKTQALEENQAQLCSIIENSPFAIWSVDTDSKLTTINENFITFCQTFFKFTPQVGKNFMEILPNDTIELWQERYYLVFRGEKLELEDCLQKNGNNVYVQTILAPIHNDKLEITGVLAMVRDISNRKKIEQQLVYEKSLLETFMNYSVDHIYFKDAESRFVRVNQSWLNTFLPDDDVFSVIGKTDADFFDSAEERLLDELNIMLTGEILIDKEESFKSRTGEPHWISTTKVPWYDDNNSIIGTFGISRDITERKRIETELRKKAEELKELNATKDKFFSIIAHDLKNPFSTVMQLSEMMLSNLEKYKEGKLQKFLGLIFDSASMGFSLLENLLQWSRSQTGRLKWTPENIDIQQIIQETIDFLSTAAQNKSIQLQTIPQEDLSVYADRNMLTTILRNLVSNAIKFSYPDSKVEIFADSEPNGVKVTVKDYGTGIVAENLERLFRIDQNFSTEGTANEQGTGLGLILCKEFAEKNKGKIYVESVEKQGSKFIVTLPKGN